MPDTHEVVTSDFLYDLKRCIKFILILCVVTICIQVILDGGFYLRSALNWVRSNFFFGIPFYFSNAYLDVGLNRIYSWLDNPKKRALIGIPAFMIMNSLLMLVMIYVFSKFIFGIENPDILSQNNMISIVISLTICLVATLYFHAVGFLKGYVNQIKVSKQLEEEKTAAELNALKSQVNPHFLFNSFNVLSGLIDEDPRKAKSFLSELSKIYRYILENRNEDLSTVAEELAFAEKYLNLQKTRFENSIDVQIDVSESAKESKVPVLSLQLLLENAIKHNSFDEHKPLAISIKNENESILVSNNKTKKRLSLGNSGIGLENIKQRYELHKKEGFVIEDGDHLFKVTLPLI